MHLIDPARYPIEIFRRPPSDQPKYHPTVRPIVLLQGHLAKVQDGFSHLVVADVKFEVFTRAWCIAEIVESEASTIPKRSKFMEDEH